MSEMVPNPEHRRLGGELNWEIVSCRPCVHAVCMSSEFGVKIYGRGLSLFPFWTGRFSLSPSPRPQSPIQLQLALLVFRSYPDVTLVITLSQLLWLFSLRLQLYVHVEKYVIASVLQ